MRINNIELLYMTDNESRATNVRNNHVPRAYNKPWPRFAVSRDEKNKKPKSIEMKRAEITEKLKADLEKIFLCQTTARVPCVVPTRFYYCFDYHHIPLHSTF